ncbi:MAG: deoxyguanosinetriphosphate triphosphohydrolase [Alphaproteobacteria bacterium]|nr:MAG: deoxyguanosinetriphosphate triphosphohydrolase [Alphaproteobacteria bacterium]
MPDAIEPLLHSVSTATGKAAYAVMVSRGRRVDEPDHPERSPFQRDRDRVIHSTAFRRLQHKTQVFVSHTGDHYRTRLTHSIEVAQIARTLARALGLDEDLAEALALAHDLGHTCFGHAGEEALASCMRPYGGFDHNDQTVRVLTLLERRYAAFDGLNLTWDTLEGVVKHNGPLKRPTPSIAALDQAWPLDLHQQPSLEAQVAALADDIAYNTHDIDDGLRAGLFTVDDLLDLPLVGPVFAAVRHLHPALEWSRLRHEAIRRLVNAMVGDLLAETRKRLAQVRPDHVQAVRACPTPLAAFSAEMVVHDRALKTFLYERFWRHPSVTAVTDHAKQVVVALFERYHGDPAALPERWRALALGEPPVVRARMVADYIAGMTDRFAYQDHARLFTDTPTP